MVFAQKTRLRFIFIVYWFLLAYIIAALVWWFIALNTQNHQMATYKIMQLKKDDPLYEYAVSVISDFERRKTDQYIGEGSIFLLLIIVGAVFLYRAVRRQFRSSQQQQNFIMAITHELKTPIAVTKLNLETLQKRKLEEAQQQRDHVGIRHQPVVDAAFILLFLVLLVGKGHPRLPGTVGTAAADIAGRGRGTASRS